MPTLSLSSQCLAKCHFHSQRIPVFDMSGVRSGTSRNLHTNGCIFVLCANKIRCLLTDTTEYTHAPGMLNTFNQECKNRKHVDSTLDTLYLINGELCYCHLDHFFETKLLLCIFKPEVDSILFLTNMYTAPGCCILFTVCSVCRWMNIICGVFTQMKHMTYDGGQKYFVLTHIFILDFCFYSE